MSTEGFPRPGSFGLSEIGGLLGKLIRAGQAFSGDTSPWTHAFIVLDDSTVIEAMPGGARIVPLEDRLKHPKVVFCDQPVQDWLKERREAVLSSGEYTDPEMFLTWLDSYKREAIVDNARRLEGTHYGYFQYLLLGLISMGIQWQWLRNRVKYKGAMICSQLVDETYRRAGIEIFDDGRLPQDVTPGDLALRYGLH